MPIICCEGADCSGKSTVASAITEWLQSMGQPVILARNPGTTALGKTLRKLIKQPDTFDENIEIDPYTERLLFLCDNSSFVETILKKNLDKWIIMDRCNFISDIIYGMALGVELTAIQKMHACIENSPLIDMLFVFRCPDNVLAERRITRGSEKCRIEQYGDNYLMRVNKAYSTLLEVHGHYLTHFVQSTFSGGTASNGRTFLQAEYVDASQPVNDVTKIVINKIANKFKSKFTAENVAGKS